MDGSGPVLERNGCILASINSVIHGEDFVGLSYFLSILTPQLFICNNLVKMMSKEKIHCYKKCAMRRKKCHEILFTMHDPIGVMTKNVCALKVCTLTQSTRPESLLGLLQIAKWFGSNGFQLESEKWREAKGHRQERYQNWACSRPETGQSLALALHALISVMPLPAGVYPTQIKQRNQCNLQSVSISMFLKNPKPPNINFTVKVGFINPNTLTMNLLCVQEL